MDEEATEQTWTDLEIDAFLEDTFDHIRLDEFFDFWNSKETIRLRPSSRSAGKTKGINVIVEVPTT